MSLQSEPGPSEAEVLYGELWKQFDTKVEILVRVYNLHVDVMWECQWTHVKKEDLCIMAFMSNYTAPRKTETKRRTFWW